MDTHIATIDIHIGKHRVATEDRTLQDMFLTLDDKPLIYTTLWIALKTILSTISEEDVAKTKKDMKVMPAPWGDAYNQMLQGDPRWLSVYQAEHTNHYTRHSLKVLTPLIYQYLQDVSCNFPPSVVPELKKILGTNDIRTLSANSNILLKLPACITKITQVIGQSLNVDEIYLTALFKEALGADTFSDTPRLTQYTILLQLLIFITTITQNNAEGQQLIADVILNAETRLNQKQLAGTLSDRERAELDFLLLTMYKLFQRKYINIRSNALKKTPLDQLPLFVTKDVKVKDPASLRRVLDKLAATYGEDKFNLLLAADANTLETLIDAYPIPCLPSTDMATWLLYAKEYQMQSSFIEQYSLNPLVYDDVVTKVFTRVLTEHVTLEKDNTNTRKTIKKMEHKLSENEGVIAKLKETVKTAQDTTAHQEVATLKKQLAALSDTVKLKDQKILKLQSRVKTVESKQLSADTVVTQDVPCELVSISTEPPEAEVDFEQLLELVNAYSYYVVGGHERLHMNLQTCLSNAKYVKVEEHPRKKAQVVDYLIVIADAVKHSQVEQADKTTAYTKKIFVTGSNVYNIVKSIASEVGVSTMEH